jgi:hypothetical protein
MAVSQGKMLGHYCRGGPGGYRCPCCKPFEGARWRKRDEARELARDLAPVADDEWLASLVPLIDPSDCRHGCNGDCIARGTGSDVCNFLCHPGLDYIAFNG